MHCVFARAHTERNQAAAQLTHSSRIDHQARNILSNAGLSFSLCEAALVAAGAEDVGGLRFFLQVFEGLEVFLCLLQLGRLVSHRGGLHCVWCLSIPVNWNLCHIF